MTSRLCADFCVSSCSIIGWQHLYVGLLNEKGVLRSAKKDH